MHLVPQKNLDFSGSVPTLQLYSLFPLIQRSNIDLQGLFFIYVYTISKICKFS